MSEQNHAKRVRLTGFAMLLVMMAALVIAEVNRARGIKLFESYMTLLPFMFLGMSLLRPVRRTQDCWIGLVWIGWLVASRVLLGDPYFVRSGYEWFVLDCAACLFALPFAWQMEDGEKRSGLYLTACFLFVIISLGAWISLICGVQGKMISIPHLGGSFGFNLEGPFYRLVMCAHPNISAALIGLAIMLGIWLLTEGKVRRWMMIPMLVMLAGMYTAFALTMSRTNMIQMALFAAMLLVLLLLRRMPRHAKARWVKIACIFVAGVVVLVVVFQSSYWIVDGVNGLKKALVSSQEKIEKNTTDVTQAAPEAKEQQVDEAASYVEARPLGDDLATMTGRSDIYRKTIENLMQNPKALLLGGTNGSGLVPEGFSHTHNVYLQVIVRMGIPGLLLALWFSIRAVWASGRIVICNLKKASVSDIVLVCTILVMLVGTIPETYLFYNGETKIYNVVFFLLYGYLMEADRRLRKAE